MNTQSKTVCFDCNLPNPIFVSRPERGRSAWAFHSHYVAICETCAEKLPDQFVVHLSEDGCVTLASDGTLEGARHALTQLLEGEGRRGLADAKLRRIPGKHVFQSTYDHVRFGQLITFTATIDGRISIHSNTDRKDSK